MRILVTGGLGFVGTNLAAAWLADRDVQLRIFDNGSAGSVQPPLLQRAVEVLQGDVRDAAAVHAASSGVDAIVHLAAQTGVVQSLDDPRTSVDVNVTGTLNVLEAARRTGVSRVVFASSNAAVGAHEPPLTETSVPCPVSPYGATKLAGEALCQAYAAGYGMRTVALRFSNLYGPHSLHKGSVVTTFFRAAMSGQPVTVHGNGSQTRDFLFTEDLARAIWLAIEWAPAGSVYQVGSGNETSVLDLACRIRRIVERDLQTVVELRQEPARSGDVPRNYSSIARARAELGFDPKVSLDEGLGLTWNWFRASAATPATV